MVTARNGKSKNFKGQMSGAPGTAFYRQDDACPVGFVTAQNKTKKNQPNNNYQIFPSFSRKDLLMYLFLNKKYSNNFNFECICIVSFLNIQELCHRVMITFCRNFTKSDDILRCYSNL